MKLCSNGLTIEWCNDIRSYKKLIPALKQYPDPIIITVDDDFIYDENMALNLYNSYLEYPNCVHSLVVTRLYYAKKDVLAAINAFKLKEYGGKYDINVFKPCAFYKSVGCWGCLYPPHSLHKDVFNLDIAYKCCPHNDDVWFHFQALRKGYKIVCPKKHTAIKSVIEGSQDVGLCKTNCETLYDSHVTPFDIELNNLYRYYPELKNIFLSDNNCDKFAILRFKFVKFYEHYLKKILNKIFSITNEMSNNAKHKGVVLFQLIEGSFNTILCHISVVSINIQMADIKLSILPFHI